MDELEVERLGGFAGFGVPGGRIRSVGRVSMAALSDSDRATVNGLFEAASPPAEAKPDEFRYRLTRHTASGRQTVEAPARLVPEAIENSVHEELS